MGNRAVIIFDDAPKLGVYLHWNGGRGSVEAFLDEAKRRGVRSSGSDHVYCVARFSQLVGEFFSYSGAVMNHETSLGVGVIDDLDIDNGDNGVYYVDKEFAIRIRRDVPSHASNGDRKYDKICRENIGEFFNRLESCIVSGMEIEA